MLEAQSQISFDDDNELFRQDTDAESDGEEQQELDLDDLDDEDEEDARDDGEPVVLVPAEPPSSKRGVKSKEQQQQEEDKKGSETATPKTLPKGKETVLIIRPTKSSPEPVAAEKKKPLTLVELPVDVLKEIVKEVGLRHPPSAPPQLRVRQLLFYLPPSLPLGGGSNFLVWWGRGGGRGAGGNFAADNPPRR